MQKFNKLKTIEEGYLPIYANNIFTMVFSESTVDNMKALEGFCSCNGLNSSRIAKLQGGYYFLNGENRWEFLNRTLGFISFITIYNKLKSI
jgi:hypothetical protein